MTGFQKPPPEPTGGELDAIYLRRLYNWLRDMRILSIQGARQIPEPTGGIHIIIPPPKYPFQPQSTQNVFYPFKIYPQTNLQTLVGQTLPMIVNSKPGGPTVNATIVGANVPTNLAANTPQISIQDTWRFWQIRWGYVEVRQNYATANVSPPAPFATFENYANQLYLNGVGQFFGGNPDDTNPASIPIVLGSTPDGDGAIGVALWIQITQDTSSAVFATANINGGTYTVVGIAEIPPVFINSGQNSIPIGVIVGLTSNLLAYNYIYDHARNRYPPGNGNWPAGAGNGTVRNHRGSVSRNTNTGVSSATKADLGLQIFYPGDEIWVYSFSSAGSGSVNVNGIFQFIGSTPAFVQADANGVPEPESDSNWKVVFSSSSTIATGYRP